MANIRNLQRSFGGGELSPEMLGRIDDNKYQSGLALCRNFIVRPQGPAHNRAGFSFVREAKDSAHKVRLIPFTYSTTQTMVLEFGHLYVRFHTQGATLLNGAAPYEISSDYQSDDLFDIHFVQSADVLTLVHPNYPPKELRRNGATNWGFSNIVFNIGGAYLPSYSSASMSNANGVTITNYLDYSYVMTAVATDLTTETTPTAVMTCSNNLNVSGAKNQISWSYSGYKLPGFSHHNIYKFSAGSYGYIGNAINGPFIDDNIAPDLSKTPPREDTLFSAKNDYPAAVSYFEQRRCFAGTRSKPQNIWMTKSGTESNMSYSIPTRDDDRIAFRVSAREASAIRHIIPLSQLVLLTSSGEWMVTSVNSDALTPSSISVKPQSYVGASNVQPLVINNTLIYGAARGGHVREMAYSWQSGGFTSGDLSLRSAHLFDNEEIVDMAYSKAPLPVVWLVSTSGKLLGFTYVPEQQIGAWHQHDTQDGVFESCCAVAEGKEDALYCVIRRTIGGVSKRYIERMSSRQFTDQKNAFFVDSGLGYSGAAASTLSGLGHLEGKTVSILADGYVHPERTVAGGMVTLEQAASVIHVGLPITAQLQTLPMAAQVDNAFGQGRYKNVNQVWLRVQATAGFWAGPSASQLTEAKVRTTENYGNPVRLQDGEVRLVLTPTWGSTGQVFVQQAQPLPITLINLTSEIALGG